MLVASKVSKASPPATLFGLFQAQRVFLALMGRAERRDTLASQDLVENMDRLLGMAQKDSEVKRSVSY